MNAHFKISRGFGWLLAVGLVVSSLNCVGADAGADGAKKKEKPKKAAKVSKAEKSRVGRLHHVVSFKFKAAATPEQIHEVETAFKALKGKIPGIVSLKAGTNISPENLNKGFTHCWVLTFASDKDRDAYLVHPDHKAFGKIVGPVLEDVMVIDFLSKD